MEISPVTEIAFSDEMEKIAAAPSLAQQAKTQERELRKGLASAGHLLGWKRHVPFTAERTAWRELQQGARARRIGIAEEMGRILGGEASQQLPRELEQAAAGGGRKALRVALGAGLIGVPAYLGYRWYKGRQRQQPAYGPYGGYY